MTAIFPSYEGVYWWVLAPFLFILPYSTHTFSYPSLPRSTSYNMLPFTQSPVQSRFSPSALYMYLVPYPSESHRSSIAAFSSLSTQIVLSALYPFLTSHCLTRLHSSHMSHTSLVLTSMIYPSMSRSITTL